MRIAVSATRPSVDAPLDPRFGRCACFVIVDAEGGSVEVVENANAALGSGAGIQSAQTVEAAGAQVVLTGNCGPNAMNVLSAAGIQVVTGCTGTVAQVVEQYKAGQLQPVSEPNVAAHFGADATAPEGQAAPTQGGSLPPIGQGQMLGFGQGTGGGRGRGRGEGMGRGQGRGRGGGRGKGRGRGRGGGR